MLLGRFNEKEIFSLSFKFFKSIKEMMRRGYTMVPVREYPCSL
jgi:hypothetical protein